MSIIYYLKQETAASLGGEHGFEANEVLKGLGS
jgi:hypothetical protein